MSKTTKRKRWFDCLERELFAGDTVRGIGTGEEEKVYECVDAFSGEMNLGLNASNEKFLEAHPDWPREVYPFDNFSFRWKNGNRCLIGYEKVVK